MIADHDEIESSLGAYLLGAVDAEESDVVRTHSDGCSTCQEIIRRLQHGVDALPMAVEAAFPPPRLREKILAAAAVSRGAALRRPQRARVLRLPRPRAPLWSPGARTAVASAAIVAFALGAGIGVGIGRFASPPPPQVAAVAQYTMSGSGSMSGAQGRVFELRQQGLTLIEFSNLPQPEQGKVYELWFISKDGDAAPSGVFAPDSRGSHVILVASNLSGVTTLAVTQEIGPNGSMAPTQQPQLVGSIG
jgi:anti-sigma-K factor RskA